ncbi:SHOCT domain-containing protein [Actinoplanes sp. URMC 104]|uniref:SHOCT domain-containing protein n=1 Tax=Actinoplanes sp. URMC 104 TaxID=3423409 RepID=UPI003F1CA178
MRTRVLIASIVGVLAALAAGFGTYAMGSLGDCVATDSCQVPIGVTIATFGAGLLVAVLATVAGGGLLVMAATFTAIGAGALLAAPHSDVSLWILGVAFVLGGLWVLRIAVPVTRDAVRRQVVEDTGVSGTGVAPPVTDSGATVNGGLADQLAKLDELHRSGALTAAEFDAAKARLLAG